MRIDPSTLDFEPLLRRVKRKEREREREGWGKIGCTRMRLAAEEAERRSSGGEKEIRGFRLSTEGRSVRKVCASSISSLKK